MTPDIEAILAQKRIFWAADKPGNRLHGLNDLIDFVESRSPLDTVVEIGCFAGVSTELFASRFQHVITVDVWEKAIAGGVDAYDAYSVDDLRKVHVEFEAKRLRYENIRLIEEFSVDAAKLVPDNSVDLVYIDGNHHYQAVLKDVMAWRLKVRRAGGFLAGHDYDMRGVRRAVDELFMDAPRVFADTSWIIEIKDES